MHTHNREGVVPIVVSNRHAEQGRFHFNKIQYCNYYLYFNVDKCPLTSGPQNPMTIQDCIIYAMTMNVQTLYSPINLSKVIVSDGPGPITLERFYYIVLQMKKNQQSNFGM